SKTQWAGQISIARDRLPPARSKVLADADCVVPAPGAIGPQVRGAKIPIACPETVKEKMLGDPDLKSSSQVNGGAPGMFDSDGVGRPGVEVLRNILAKQESWLPKQHEATDLTPSERSNLQQAGQHVPGECIAGRVCPAEGAGIGPAQVGIYLVVWWGNIELDIAQR